MIKRGGMVPLPQNIAHSMGLAKWFLFGRKRSPSVFIFPKLSYVVNILDSFDELKIRNWELKIVLLPTIYTLHPVPSTTFAS